MVVFYPCSIHLEFCLIHFRPCYIKDSVLRILKGNAGSQTLRGHFIIDQCLPALMVENYTSIQENVTPKSKLYLNNLYLNVFSREYTL